MNNSASNPKCIPELRFPGFAGEWIAAKLGNIASFSKGKGISKEDISIDGQLECIRYGELYTHYREVISMIISRTNLKKNDLVISESNDIIIPASGETTIDISKASCVLKDGVALGGDLNIIKTINNGVFLTYYLNFTKKVDIARLAQGISVVHLYADQLRTLNLLLPTIPEQTKIASFLTAVDDKIRQLTRKKELLEQYKKGVMQKIFNREIRFRDEEGKEYPECKRYKFGDIYRFISTNSLSRENLNYSEGEIRNIHYGDIHTKFSTLFIVEDEEVPYINSNTHLHKIDEENFCKAGDLIIADASEDYDDIGKTIEISSTKNEKIMSGLHTIHARPDLRIMHVGFGGYFMKSESVKNQIKTIAQGIKVLSISALRLSNVTVEIPIKSEQSKIASFLSSIDQKITLVARQLENMQTWKKGLLQRMFV